MSPSAGLVPRSARVIASVDYAWARVLDGNNGLVGERLQEIDLNVREWPGLGSGDEHRANRYTFGHQGDPAPPDEVTAAGKWSAFLADNRSAGTYP
jgi:hypothetical protein